MRHRCLPSHTRIDGSLTFLGDLGGVSWCIGWVVGMAGCLFVLLSTFGGHRFVMPACMIAPDAVRIARSARNDRCDGEP
jgi:hypothetical protein